MFEVAALTKILSLRDVGKLILSYMLGGTRHFESRGLYANVGAVRVQ